MTDKFNGLTDDEMKQELARRQLVREEAARVAADNRRESLLKAVMGGSLWDLVEHDRTSCSDGHPINDGRCTRCTLLQIQKDRWVDLDIDGIEVSIRYNRQD